MKTCTNCDELYDEREGAWGLCEPCWQSARADDGEYDDEEAPDAE